MNNNNEQDLINNSTSQNKATQSDSKHDDNVNENETKTNAKTTNTINISTDGSKSSSDGKYSSQNEMKRDTKEIETQKSQWYKKSNGNNINININNTNNKKDATNSNTKAPTGEERNNMIEKLMESDRKELDIDISDEKESYKGEKELIMFLKEYRLQFLEEALTADEWMLYEWMLYEWMN